MSRTFSIGFGVAVVVIALFIWRGFVETRGNHLDPVGKIGKVRAEKVDENEMIAIIDFNLRNDSDLEMVVRSVESQMTAADGSVVNGGIIAAADLANFFSHYPNIGEQYNPPLKARDTLAGHQATDRMVGVRFDVSEEAWTKRKGVVLRIEDKTGPVTELKAR